MSEDMSFKVQDKFIRDLLNAVTLETREFMVGDSLGLVTQ